MDGVSWESSTLELVSAGAGLGVREIVAVTLERCVVGKPAGAGAVMGCV